MRKLIGTLGQLWWSTGKARCGSTSSSRRKRPSSLSCISAVPVTVFEIEASMKGVSGRTGRSFCTSRRP